GDQRPLALQHAIGAPERGGGNGDGIHACGNVLGFARADDLHRLGREADGGGDGGECAQNCDQIHQTSLLTNSEMPVWRVRRSRSAFRMAWMSPSALSTSLLTMT